MAGLSLIDLQKTLRDRVREAALELFNVALEQVVGEVPPRTELGDLAFPVAFELAKRIKQATGEKRAPRAIAEQLAKALEASESVARVEVAGAGYLNVLTTDAVLRRKYGSFPEFLTVRFGKHRGFDRVVFELKGDLIGYFVKYGEPPFQAEGGDTTIKVRGKAFVEIQLYPVASSDENIQANGKLLTEQNKVKMALIREVKAVEWFEGELRYVVGLNRETPFRVQVLSNPTRLVVDFKH